MWDIERSLAIEDKDIVYGGQLALAFSSYVGSFESDEASAKTKIYSLVFQTCMCVSRRREKRVCLLNSVKGS